ncbi:MAG: ArnT family glycosyltransferase [Planctomycetota bacterium]|jgi:4-amino-4-deoxy-L-arabinose transferase-like glycosyltransferase
MEQPAGDGRKNNILLVLLISFLVLIPLQALLSIKQKSATFEEAVHLAAGAYYWNTWEMEACPGYPPLVRMCEALPLWVAGARLPEEPMPSGEMYPFPHATRFLYELNDADTLLFMSRIMVAALAVLLGIYVYRFAKDLFGPGAALVALFLFTFSPNILAHSRLATLDLALTAFLFITLFYYRRACIDGGKHNFLLAMLFSSLALSAKYTALLLFPVLILWNLALLFCWGGSRRRAWGLFLLVVIACLLLINVQYGFEGTFESLSDSKEAFKSTLVKDLAGGSFTGTIPLPLPRAYVLGFDLTVYNDRDANHPNWYLGELYMQNEHWWHYYLTALLIKVPLPMLLLLLVTLIQAVLAIRRTPEAIMLFIPCVVFLLFFSLVCQSQLGLRLLLPAFPFAFVATGVLAPFLFMNSLSRKLFLGLALGWYLAASLFIHPHYLSYFNVLIGGPTEGVKYLADSNLDWGQDLKGLKAYMEEEGLERIRILYYGPDGSKEPAYYGIEAAPADAADLPWAVSATWLYYPRYAFFRQKEPIERIGYSILVYEPNR